MRNPRALWATVGIGAIVCVVSLSVARVLVRRDPAGRPITRRLAWDGAESLTVAVPAHVRFVQAPGPGVVEVTGPRRSVETFDVADGVLQDGTLRTGEALEIVVTAPRVTRFSVKGSDKLTIEQFDQDLLRIEATGWAEVMATGRAGSVKLSLAGSGWVNLSQLVTDGADITLTGSRHAILAPRAWAAVAGAGTVILLTRPEKLSLDLEGGGRVIQVSSPSAN